MTMARVIMGRSIDGSSLEGKAGRTLGDLPGWSPEAARLPASGGHIFFTVYPCLQKRPVFSPAGALSRGIGTLRRKRPPREMPRAMPESSLRGRAGGKKFK